MQDYRSESVNYPFLRNINKAAKASIASKVEKADLHGSGTLSRMKRGVKWNGQAANMDIEASLNDNKRSLFDSSLLWPTPPLTS
jgi:hypothetical protein